MKLIKKIFSWNEIQGSHRLMMLLVLVLGLLNFFWGEKVQAGGGFGWDGVLYADMVRNLESLISGGQLSSYYAQRMLPSFIVRSMLDFSGAPLSNTNIISAFELYNLVLLLGACWVWKRLADNLSLSLAGRWIGFSGIFINFQASKQAFYNPVLTDVTALFVAMLLLLFYMEKKQIALFVVTIIGAFSWPVVSVCGAFLLLFLRSDFPDEVVKPVKPIFTFNWASLPFLASLAGLALLTLSIIAYMAITQVGSASEQACNVYKVLANVMLPNVVPCFPERVTEGLGRLLTAIPSIVGMLVALAMLIGSRAFFLAVIDSLRKVPISLVLLAIAAVFIPFYMVKFFSNPAAANVSSLPVLISAILLPAQKWKFLLPIVTLAVFWGPLVLLLILYWKAFCIEARKLGPGVVAIIGISLGLGLVGEPRFMAIAWPFLVIGIVLVLEGSSMKPSFKYVLTALTIVYAQFWIKFNYAPWLPPDGEGLQEFPKQLYFMHYGLWMSWLSYCVQLVALVLSAIWLRKSVVKIGAS